MKFRELSKLDVELQKSFLLIGLWTPDGCPDTPPEALDKPHIKAYYENWGREGDLGIIALGDNEQAIGLIQIRIKACVTPQYADLAEIALAVSPDSQGKGVGSLLMAELFSRIPNHVKGLRLGVHPENRAAMALYTKFGFVHYDTPEAGYPQMVWLPSTTPDETENNPVS